MNIIRFAFCAILLVLTTSCRSGPGGKIRDPDGREIGEEYSSRPGNRVMDSLADMIWPEFVHKVPQLGGLRPVRVAWYEIKYSGNEAGAEAAGDAFKTRFESYMLDTGKFSMVSDSFVRQGLREVNLTEVDELMTPSRRQEFQRVMMASGGQPLDMLLEGRFQAVRSIGGREDTRYQMTLTWIDLRPTSAEGTSQWSITKYVEKERSY